MLGLMARPQAAFVQMGYSLLELLVTLAIVAILASVAVPSFSDFVRNQKLRSATNDLVSSLQLARSEAVKRNVDVSVTKASGGWSEGWSVISGGTTLRSTDGPSSVELSVSHGSIAYASNGRINSAVTAEFAVTGDASNKKCVRISLSGAHSIDEGEC